MYKRQVQETRWGLRGRSWFVYEHTDDAIRADDLSDKSDPEQIDQLLGTMVRNLVRMREHGLSHGDMKPPNYLITASRAVMIDLDGVRQHKHAGACQQALARDVARWTRWWDQDDPQPRISKKSKACYRPPDSPSTDVAQPDLVLKAKLRRKQWMV